MKKLIIVGAICIALGSSGQIFSTEMQGLPEPETRALPALCATCPVGAAKFCSLCVTGPVVVGDLTVQGTLTLCSGSTGCACVYDGYLSWNDQETLFNIKDYPNPVCSGCTGVAIPLDVLNQLQFTQFANGAPFISPINSGWVIPPSFSAPNLTITAEFEVPADFDPTVSPVITLHWFNFVAQTGCTGSFVNWEITADTHGNGSPMQTGSPQYVVQTGDIPLIINPGFEVQQQTSVTLATGPGFIPGGYGAISTTRAPTATGDAEYGCSSLLTVIGLQYRKKPL